MIRARVCIVPFLSCVLGCASDPGTTPPPSLPEGPKSAAGKKPATPRASASACGSEGTSDGERLRSTAADAVLNGTTHIDIAKS